MARAYLVLMTIQAVGLCFCVNQVPDLDLVVIGGGSKDALAKRDVLDISSSITITIIVTITILLIIIITESPM